MSTIKLSRNRLPYDKEPMFRSKSGGIVLSLSAFDVPDDIVIGQCVDAEGTWVRTNFRYHGAPGRSRYVVKNLALVRLGTSPKSGRVQFIDVHELIKSHKNVISLQIDILTEHAKDPIKNVNDETRVITKPTYDTIKDENVLAVLSAQYTALILQEYADEIRECFDSCE